MKPFADLYALYYDLLYRDKDYQAEADYVATLIRQYHPQANSLLDLGCGTGKHAQCFAAQGLRVHGVDRSSGMLALAHARTRPGQLTFSQGDIRALALDERFDVVTALFHVMSYQTSVADLNAVFSGVAQHLAPGGLFIFDFWYGPAVLTDRPVVRVKRLENELVQVTRVAEPECIARDNLVKVQYDIFIQDKQQQQHQHCQEQHLMRYFFDPELDLLAQQHGFTTVASLAWQSDRAPDFNSWYAVRVLQR